MQDNNPTNLENRTTTAEVENFTNLTSNQSHASLPSASDVNLRHELTDLLLNGTAIPAETGGNNFKLSPSISNLKLFFSNISNISNTTTNPNNNSVSKFSNTSNSTKSVNFLPVAKSPFGTFLQNQSDHQIIGNTDIMNLANHGRSTPTVAGLTSDPNIKPTPEPDQTDALLSAFSMESWVLLGCIGVLGTILALIILIGSCILGRKRYKKPRAGDKRKENKSPKVPRGEKPTQGSSTSTETTTTGTTTTTSQSTDTSIPYRKLQIVNKNKNNNNNKRKEELKLDTPPKSVKSLSLEPAEREDLDPSADSKSGPVPRYEFLSDNGQESYEVILSSSGQFIGGSSGFQAKRYDRIKSPTPKKSGQLLPEELASIQEEESNGPNGAGKIGDGKKK